MMLSFTSLLTYFLVFSRHFCLQKKTSFPLHSCTTTITSYNRPQQRHITCVFLRHSRCFSKQFLCSLLECTLSLQLIKTEAYNPGANIALGVGGGGGHATLGACIDVIVILNFASEVTYPLQPLAQSKP